MFERPRLPLMLNRPNEPGESLTALGSLDQVTPQALVNAGLIKKKTQLVKILGLGEVARAIVVQAHKFSQSAKEKIEAAGGRAEVIGGV